MGWRGDPGGALAGGALGDHAGRGLHAGRGPAGGCSARRDRGAISVYARGRDYHDLVKPRLKRLGRLAGRRDRGGDQGLRRHRAGDGEAAGGRRRGIGWQGKHTNLLGRELGQLVLPRRDLHHAGAAARRAGGRPLRLVPGLPRRLPDGRVPGALPARCAALHLLSDDRARRAGRRGAAAGARQPHLRLRRLPGGLPVEQVRGARRARRAYWARAELAAPRLDGPGGARRRRASGRCSAGSPIKRIGRDRFVRNVAYAIGNSGDARAGCRRRGGWRRDADPTVRDAAPGRWGGSVERLQVAPGRARRGRGRDAPRSAAARAPAAAAVSPVSAQRGGGLEERLGQVRVERRAPARPRRARPRGRPARRSAAASSAWARASPGSAASSASSAARAAGQSRGRGGGAGAQEQPLGRRRRRARRRGRARRAARSGWPASSHSRAASSRIDRAQRRRPARGWGSRRARSGAAPRWRGRPCAESAAASQSRAATPPPVRSQSAAASRAAAGSAATAAAQSSAERISAPGRRRQRERGRAGAAGASAGSAWTRHDPTRAADARPWLLGGAAGGKPAAGWRVLGTTRSPEKAAAMRAAGVEPVDWADAGAVDAAIAAADAPARLAAAGRGGRPGAGAARRGAGGGAAGLGGLSLDHRGLRRPAGRLGGRGRARSRRSTSAAAGGWRRSAPGSRAGCRCTSSGSPASTGRGAAPSTGCARGGRSASSSRARSSAASTSTTSPRCSRASMARPAPGAGLQRRRRPAGAAAGRDRLRGGAARAAAAAGGCLRGGGALADGAELLRGVASAWRTGGSRRSSAWRSPTPTTARGWRAILAAGG